MKNKTANAMFPMSWVARAASLNPSAPLLSSWLQVGARVAQLIAIVRTDLDVAAFVRALTERFRASGAHGQTPVAVSEKAIADAVMLQAAFTAAAARDPVARGLVDAMVRDVATHGGGRESLMLAMLSVYGAPEFRIFPDLMDALLRTAVRCPVEKLCFPFPAFEVILPRAAGGRWMIGGGDGTAYPARSVVCLLSLDPVHLSPVLGLDVVGRPDDDRDENIQRFAVALSRLYGADRMLVEDDVLAAVIGGVDDVPAEILRLVLNLVLYLGSEGADSRPRAAGAPIVPPGDGRGVRARQHDVGRRIVIPGGGGGATTSAATGRTISTFHWVRGHWHVYPFGVGRTERKVLWVRPYSKGARVTDRRGAYDAVMASE